MTTILIHDNPQLTGEPVPGVAGGRIVAYWPTKEQVEAGLRSMCGGYIPAMIVASWQQPGVPNTTPMCNIRLELDECNHQMVIAKLFSGPSGRCLGSVRYSEAPAYGCWTWIPKA